MFWLTKVPYFENLISQKVTHIWTHTHSYIYQRLLDRYKRYTPGRQRWDKPFVSDIHHGLENSLRRPQTISAAQL